MLHFNQNTALRSKRVLLFAALVFTALQMQAQVFPVDTLMRNGNRVNRINLVYLADGYQSGELGTYITNSTTINNGLFSQPPFSQYKNYFNSFAIRVNSTESGAKHPRTASDCPALASHPIINPNNYFQSTFDFAGIHRLLVPVNSVGISNVLASNLPDFDQAFLVVNSPYYGGSGGTVATASTDPSSVEVAIHEIGHSFAGLADEYWAGDAYAAEKPNMTANSNPATVKWKAWVGINNVGVYPYGTSGNPANWYRPHQLCKMQYLGYPFCSVCTERFIDRIHQLVTMADAYAPASTSITLTNFNNADFSVTPIQTIPSTISVKWYLNGSVTPFLTNQSTASVPLSSFAVGANTIRAEITDNTALSKSYLPAAGYINNITWNVTRPAALPVRLKDFSGRIYQNAGLVNWAVEGIDDLDYFELEKSKDGVSFAKLTKIESLSGKKNYQFSDEELFNGNNYYRLKIVEKSGSSNYSSVIRLQKALEKLSYKVYQDADQHTYRLTTTLEEAQPVNIRVSDVNGKVLLKKDFGVRDNQLNYDFDLSTQAAGIYFLTINIGNKQYSAQILAK
jgi:hypothetical protein